MSKTLPRKRQQIYRMRTEYGIKRPGWCITHSDFAWIWQDGSEGCWHDCVIERNTDDHDIVPIIVELPSRALGRQKVDVS